MNFILKNKVLAVLALFVILLAPLLLMFPGCASKLDGTQTANQAPEVGFINSPPEGTNFSRNSIIYWWGTDRDGLIDYFRYHVATVDEIGIPNPTREELEQYINAIATQPNEWTVVDVDIVGSDPGTEKIIKLSADLNDPVNRYVLQYVFLQAFDEEGLGSEIKWRLFGRNDNPPETFISNPPEADLPFVNAVTKGGVITGIKMRWEGQDLIDYPADPPPFDFHYRLYGPFDSAQYAQIKSQFYTKRYLTATGLVYKLGDTIVTCDTTVIFPQQITCDTLPNGDTTSCDTTTLAPDTTITCTSLIVRLTSPCNAFGCLQDYFAIDNPAYISAYPDSSYLIHESKDPLDNTADSIWVDRTADTIFNVFSKFPQTGAADTTIEKDFILWVRSRDDALVPDLIPAYKGIRVLNPRYERDVLVVDASSILTAIVKYANGWKNLDTAKAFWYNAVKYWADGDASKLLDTARFPGGNQARDYFQTPRALNSVPISWLLKHKVVILYNEGISRPDLTLPGLMPNIYRAIDAGVNVWVTFRSLGDNGKEHSYQEVNPQGFEYTRYFGVIFTVYTGWGCHAFASRPECPRMRIEDFIGAYPKTGWPHIMVDTTFLRNRLRWAVPIDSATTAIDSNNSAAAWFDTLSCHALPEVGWSVRTFGTDLLYRYQSCYGSEHPRGQSEGGNFIFEGAPVAHRFNAGLYRTVHCNFTPMVLDTPAVMIMVDSILNWLYDPTLGTTSALKEDRYPDAALKITLDEARDNYRRRVEELELRGYKANPDGAEY